MISQQVLRERRRQRRKRQVDQLTLSIEQELSRSLHYEQYLALSALQESIAGAVQAMHHEVDALTEQHCETMVAAFQELLHVIRNCIFVLNSPDLAVERRPYPLVMKLSALHHMLIDVQVTVGNARGQCRYGRLATDPTGSYWQLRSSVREVVRDYQSLLVLLMQEHTPSSLPSGTAIA